MNPKSAKHKVQDACVAVFNSHESAERAIKELQISGFDMKKLSIVGKGYETEENVMGYYNMGDRVKFWGGQGAFWGGVWGLFFSSAFMMIPGFGQVIIAGPFVSALIGVLEGAVVVGGLSSIGAALYSLGIPRNSVLRYEAAIKANKYLLAAHGTAEEVKKARSILENAGSNDVEAHIANPVH
ncbi:MAG: permease [Bdellovibrionaceae bacterium]|nr:permease [Pseudobdellovibrionaceae bacterium]